MGTRVRGDGGNAISLLLENGSRIVGLPGVEKTTRGFSGVALLLVDEAAQVEDAVYRAVRPFVVASRGAVWLMSTPYGARGFFYETWVKGERWLKVKAPGWECARLRAEDLEEEREVQGENWFRQEYGCEFPENDEAWFAREWVDRAFQEGLRPWGR